MRTLITLLDGHVIAADKIDAISPIEDFSSFTRSAHGFDIKMGDKKLSVAYSGKESKQKVQEERDRIIKEWSEYNAL